MRRQRFRWQGIAWVFVLLLGMPLCAPDGAGAALRFADKQGDLQRIVGLERDGRYLDAALSIRKYIVRWMTKDTIEAHLLMQYRMGLDYKSAGDPGHAVDCFAYCWQHARGRSVLLNNTPLVELAGRKIQELIPAASAATAVVAIDITRIRGGKGGINLVRADPPKAYTDDEITALSQRLFMPEESEKAKVAIRSLLEKARLPFSVANRDGLLFVGIGADADEARDYAKAMVRGEARLRTLYFDSIVSSPLLTVYAVMARETDPGLFVNAPGLQLKPKALDHTVQQPFPVPGGEEQIARIVCQTLHGREMAEMEGYFQAYDNSIVLRKGLRGPNGLWYLGTAWHELIHALVQADFPRAPAWLNEGMAALYEAQSASPADEPIGNYRLYFLLESLALHRNGLVKRLLHTPADQWPDHGPALLAATARYLCLYLYQKQPGENRLQSVYRLLRDGGEDGKTLVASEEALERVTGLKLDALEADFADFIQKQNVPQVDATWAYLRENIRAYVRQVPPP